MREISLQLVTLTLHWVVHWDSWEGELQIFLPLSESNGSRNDESLCVL